MTPLVWTRDHQSEVVIATWKTLAVRAPSFKGGAAQTIWSNRITGGNIVSPVCWDSRLFSVSHMGVLTCRDAESGQIHWTMRLASRCLASLVAGDGKVY